jgi:uncharacterized YigZ family protein
MPVVRTIAEPIRYEIDKIRGSRFIADLAPASSAAEAMAFVERIRNEFPDATHHCFAWRLPGGEARSSDDGEPAGTAGKPILNQLQGQELEGVVAVVTRYYGGTKLGAGGLVRAYGGAARAAIDAARIVERRVMALVEIRHRYELSGPVKGVLAAFHTEEVSADYGTDVAMRVRVPVEDAERLIEELRDATAGQARAAVLDDGSM